MKRTTLLLSLLTAAACGKVHGLADAGNGSGIDAASFDANPRGTVKVTVYAPNGDRTPTAGISVVFIEPDGKVVARIPTDVNGKAQADVLPGSNVTAIWLTSSTSYQMETILGVKPGDDLALAGLGQDNTAAGSYTVTYPANASADAYQAYTGCYYGYSTTTSASTSLSSFCKRDPMTVAVAATSNGTLVGYLEKTNVPFVDGGTTNLTGTWQPPQTFQATYTGIDTGVVAQINTTRYTDDTLGYGAFAGSATTGATLALSAPAPQSSGKALVATFVYGTTGGSQQQFYQPINGNSFAYNLAVGTHLLPWVGLPTLDVTTGIVTVPLTGTGDKPDIAEVSVGYRRVDPNTQATTGYTWIVLGPNFDSPITLPTMPPEVGDVNPKAGDTLNNFSSHAAMAEADSITSYDQVRNDPVGAVGTLTSGRSAATFARLSQTQLAK